MNRGSGWTFDAGNATLKATQMVHMFFHTITILVQLPRIIRRRGIGSHFSGIIAWNPST